MDRDFGGELFVGVIAEVLPERVAELYLAHLRKLKYGDGGEHLVHRADANLRVELIGDLLLAVRQTVGAGEDGLAAFDDEHSTCKFILRGAFRSEEHTSELQSRLHLVCRLLLEKKKKTS